MSKLNTFASSFAVALSLTFSVFAAHAAGPSPKLTGTDSSAPAAANYVAHIATVVAQAPLNASSPSAASGLDKSKWDITVDPTSCGGIPAPRLTAADGYETVCVNDALRFVNDIDRYAYNVKVTKTVKGKKTVLNQTELVGNYLMPRVYSSGTFTPYVASVTKADGKETLNYDTVFDGYSAVLDPKARSDGKLVVEADITAQQLIDFNKHTVAAMSPVNSPNTSVFHYHGEVALSPDQPTVIDNGDIEVELTATHLAN